MANDEIQAIVRASQVFTPGAPVSSKALFSGRAEQLRRVIEAVPAPGRHPIIYGQRGVGKTSLANIIRDVVENLLVVKISCDGSDTFTSIWNRILQNASLEFKTKALGFTRDAASRTVTLAELMGSRTPTAAEVAELLAKISDLTVLILDEFDKVSDDATKRAMADLVKIVSDTAPRVTLIIVGVADNIGQLIGEHPSIERNLVQIELPTMNDEEIKEILLSGFKALNLKAEPAVIDEVPGLCNGYPHYAHLIGLSAAKACARNHTDKLTDQLFEVACSFAVEDAIERYRDAYAKATTTTQQSRYPLILCSCGFAKHNDKGVFRTTDVVDAIRAEFGQRLTIQAVVPALGEFVGEARGRVLTAVPVRKRQCYRFSDPMMRPFLRLKGRELRRVGARSAGEEKGTF